MISAHRVAIGTRIAALLGASAPASLAAVGNAEILARTKLALLCSVRCPGRIILRAYDLAQSLRQSECAVIGGFHTPMEKECLKVLLRGPAPVIVCPARDMDGMRIPSEWRQALESGRLLVLSGFAGKDDRVTAEAATMRNRLVAALADGLFVAHAAPGGKTESLCREAASWGKPIYTFNDPSNENLFAMGARVWEGRSG